MLTLKFLKRVKSKHRLYCETTSKIQYGIRIYGYQMDYSFGIILTLNEDVKVLKIFTSACNEYNYEIISIIRFASSFQTRESKCDSNKIVNLN